MKASDRGSFRDLSGFVFVKNKKIFRQINPEYFTQYRKFCDSGLSQFLISNKLLISHKEIQNSSKKIILEHEKVPYISYPYEWSFSMLKDAALLTLKILKKATEHEMILKDASAYNVQFIGTKPIFIDTLSFDFYKEGETWIAYKQFCQHFLAPLALMAKEDIRLNTLLRNHIDGIPLDIASKLLPTFTKLNLSILSHIHLHAQNQKRMSDKKINSKKYKMTKFQMLSLIENLNFTINRLKLGNVKTEWEKYYSFTNYKPKSFKEKHKIVDSFIQKVKPKTALDLGANTGEFSKIACKHGAYTVASDIDPLAVETCYNKNQNNEKLLPIIVDLKNPSPAIGWSNSERKSFTDRFCVDVVMALAIIHHLAISNNLPFEMIAKYFSKLGKYLIIEFVPKNDSKVKILLQNREDIFTNYSREYFEKSFSKYFRTREIKCILNSKRILYLFEKK